MGQRTHSKIDRQAVSATAHRDTPPVDVYFVKAGFLACGSSPLSVFPGFTPVTLWTSARRLQLRGQRRSHTDFPLSPGHRKRCTGNHDARTFQQDGLDVNIA